MSAIGILTNNASINATRQLSMTSRHLSDSMGKLSSGMRINSAADDAAGVAVATGFEAITRSQIQAQRNSNDAVSMLQTAESAYGTISDVLIRMRELAVQAANDTLTDTDRGFIDTEFQQLILEVDRISNVTEFNGIQLLDASAGAAADGAVVFQVGVRNTTDNQIGVSLQQVNSTFVKVNGQKVTSLADAQAALDEIDDGLEAINTERATLGGTINQLTWASDSLGVAHENLSTALSQIRDVDVAAESATFQGQNVLMQAGVAMLSQANQQPNLALRLLGN